MKNKKLVKILGVVMMVALVALSCVSMAFASGDVTNAAVLDGDAAVSAAQGLFNSITSVLNFANIAKVLGIGIAAVIGIWLAWWGIRKLTSMLQRVLTRGRLSL